MSTQTTIAKAVRTFPGTLAGYDDRYRFTVKAEAYQIRGNSHPHFSVTAELFKRPARDIECGGCMHREVLKAWPEIKPLVDMHLSNADDGQPMHAEENGWYWMAGALGGAGERHHGGSSEAQHWKPDGSFDGYRASTPEECLETLADHLRISLEQASALRDQIKRASENAGDNAPWTTARELFRQFVQDQAPRWKAEAEAGLAMIRELASKYNASAVEFKA